MYIRLNFRIDESALLQTFLFLSAIISSLYFLDYSRNKKTPEAVYAGCGCKKELPVCWMAMESWVVYQQQMCAGETEMFC